MFYGGRFPTYSGSSGLGVGSGGSYGGYSPPQDGGATQIPQPYQSSAQPGELMPFQQPPQRQQPGAMDMIGNGLSYGKSAYDVYGYGQKLGLWGKPAAPTTTPATADAFAQPSYASPGIAGPEIGDAAGTGAMTPAVRSGLDLSSSQVLPGMPGTAGYGGGASGAVAAAPAAPAATVPTAPFVAGGSAAGAGAMTGVGSGTTALTAGGAASEAALFGGEAAAATGGAAGLSAGAAGAGAGTAAATGAATGAAAGAGTAAASGAAAGGAAAAGAGAAAAGLAVIPVVGWVAAAALMAYSLYEGGFFKDPGGYMDAQVEQNGPISAWTGLSQFGISGF